MSNMPGKKISYIFPEGCIEVEVDTENSDRFALRARYIFTTIFITPWSSRVLPSAQCKQKTMECIEMKRLNEEAGLHRGGRESLSPDNLNFFS